MLRLGLTFARSYQQSKWAMGQRSIMAERYSSEPLPPIRPEKPQLAPGVEHPWNWSRCGWNPCSPTDLVP